MIPTLGIAMSINNSEWDAGRKSNNSNSEGPRRPNNEGPPDLEEAWRQISASWERLLGGKKNKGNGSSGGNGNNGSGGPKLPEFDLQRFGGGVWIILALIFVVWLASGIYIVDAAQRGVIQRFGRYIKTTDAGLHWRFPYPIETHQVVNFSGVRTVEVGYRGSDQNRVPKESLMLTDDENIIDILFAVQYILKDAVDHVFENRFDNGSSNGMVRQAAETAVREVIGRNKMDYVLYEGREQIATEVSDLVQEILDRYRMGIEVSKVTMQNAQPPDEVQSAFEDAVKAGQDRERQRSEGEAYANSVIPRAQGAAARLLEEAEGYKQRLVATAEGDASRFEQLNAEFIRAPQVTRKRLYLETMQLVYSNVSKVLIDSKEGSGNLLYLPLDKLMQKNTGGAAGLPVDPRVLENSSMSTGSTNNSVPQQINNPSGQGNRSVSSVINELRSRGSGLLRDRGSR